MLTKKNRTPKKPFQMNANSPQQRLARIAYMAQAALDPANSRRELVCHVKHIAVVADGKEPSPDEFDVPF